MNNNIILTGFMATGKTAVGRLLSKKLGMRYISTDSLIEKKAGLKISTIFAKKGEPYFRRLETKILRSLSKTSDAVIATGGGIVLKPENRKLLKSMGMVFLLMAKPETVNRRLKKLGQRPLLKIKDEQQRLDAIRKMLKRRNRYYLLSCDRAIDTTKLSVSEVSAKIAKIALAS